MKHVEELVQRAEETTPRAHGPVGGLERRPSDSGVPKRTPPCGHRSWRRGSVLVYAPIAMIGMCAFISLGVDFGHAQLVKSELSAAADAAARAGAAGLARNGTTGAISAASTCAAYNSADGFPVVLVTAQDVELGTWDTTARTFTPLTGTAMSYANAVRVTARHTKARGTAVQTMFGGLIGMSQVDVKAVGVAKVSYRKPGIVGLNYVTMSGTSSGGGGIQTNSYNSANSGTYKNGTPTTSSGTVLSNGNITISGNTRVYGDASAGPGSTTTVSGSATVSGSITPLSQPVSYPIQTAGTYATTNDNAKISSYFDASRNLNIGNGSLTLPAGNYYINNLTIGSSGTLNVIGAATFYVTGNMTLSGQLNTLSDLPKNLQLIATTAGSTVTVGGNSTTYGELYCPGSAISMGGTAWWAGSVIAKSIDLGGTARIVFDEAMPATVISISLTQ